MSQGNSGSFFTRARDFVKNGKGFRRAPYRARAASRGRIRTKLLRRATRQGPGEFVVGCLLSAVLFCFVYLATLSERRPRKSGQGGRRSTPPATLRRPAHTKTRPSAIPEDINASKKRVLEPQYGHNRLRLLRGLRHHRIPPAQPKTTAESRYEHQDGRRSMAVEKLDSAGPPPERIGCHQSRFLAPTWQDGSNRRDNVRDRK